MNKVKMNILSEDFNLLIEVTKSVLFTKNTKYPPVKNKNKLPNTLRTNLKRPDPLSDLYEVSVAFLGPWENLPVIPVLLWHVFQGNEKKVLNLQHKCDGSFVTLRKHKLEPVPTIGQSTSRFECEEWQWIMNLEENCEIQTGASEEMIELVFKTPCEERLEEMLVQKYKEFLAKTLFMFYDITFEFYYWGKPFTRSGIDLPVPWSVSRKLKKILRHQVGQAKSLGSAWFSEDKETKNDAMLPVEVTSVNYGIEGESDCLPVWVLGPSGIPVPNFGSTLYVQLVSQAVEVPIDLVTTYVPPAGLPPPDLCLALPPQHKLTKHTHFLVIVIVLPIALQKFHLHCQLLHKFDAATAHYWGEIVATVNEVVHHANEISEDSKEFKLCRGMSAALGSIIRLSFNRDFREKCFELLEVNNSVDAQDSMEQYLMDYLKEMHSRPKVLSSHIYHPPRAAHLPPKDSGYTNRQWFALSEKKKKEVRSKNICKQVERPEVCEAHQEEEGSEVETSESTQSTTQEESMEPAAKKYKLQEPGGTNEEVESPLECEEQEVETPCNSPCLQLNNSFETQMICELEDPLYRDNNELLSHSSERERATDTPPFVDELASLLEE